MELEQNKLNSKFFYTFDTINETDYKLEITYRSKARLWLKMFEKMQNKAAKKGEIIPNLFDTIDKFEIPSSAKSMFFPEVKLAISKNINDIFKEVNKDGCFPLSDRIENVIYAKKQDGGWMIIVKIGGQYTENVIKTKTTNSSRR